MAALVWPSFAPARNTCAKRKPSLRHGCTECYQATRIPSSVMFTTGRNPSTTTSSSNGGRHRTATFTRPSCFEVIVSCGSIPRIAVLGVFKLVSSPMCLSQQDSRSTLDRPLLSPRNRRGVRPCGGCEAVGNTTTLPPRQFEIGEVVPRCGSSLVNQN